LFPFDDLLSAVVDKESDGEEIETEDEGGDEGENKVDTDREGEFGVFDKAREEEEEEEGDKDVEVTLALEVAVASSASSLLRK